jgi:YD repeat-containing protein
MILRGNLRELLKKLRLLWKPTLIPIVFLLVFLLVAGFFAITQETGDADNPRHGDPKGDSLSLENEAGFEPEFIPASLPRWFRSNAGGMALEEIPSRLGALRHEYALLSDYVTSDELEPRLISFYKDEYIIEIRVLYKEKKETRRQWLFRDKDGNTMVNAVFRPIQEEAVPEEPEPGESALAAAESETEGSPSLEGGPEITLANTELPSEETDVTEDALSMEGEEPGYKAPEERTPGTEVPSGFIEVYNENGRIVRDYTLFQEGAEIITEYIYKGGALISAETKRKDSESMEYRKTHTDKYRYNRSYSLRNVERVFHEASASREAVDVDPVRLLFPGRVLAYEKDFLKEKMTITSDFLGIDQVDDGFRMVYDTDSKGRVLGETMYNGKDEVVWTLKNTWAGDRIIAILKTEGGNESLIEYDYDDSGNRIAERDIRNGSLERQILIDGNKETEELYLNGIVVLRAFWEDGRKISEERVRRR